MGLQIVTPRQSLPRKQAYIATSNRKVDNEVMEKKIMLGNEAFARGAYEAGVKVVSSYPGTPSTEEMCIRDRIFGSRKIFGCPKNPAMLMRNHAGKLKKATGL